ncbi:hypothetical protein L3X38_013382 [Prunus dulcis]|uniref:Uncharacterized protein n=1 Tax=Prunus dulcis TaxID=3755 RepID=A0AAD4ZGX8_PRUDU|nr:hypothetical protein L3X38_013382 [Prunus dulcis]
MAKDLLYWGGFWMEGCVDNYNDMEEIRRMLRQLTERIARIEARTQIGKSSDGERCVNPYLNRVARIDTLSHGSLDRSTREIALFIIVLRCVSQVKRGTVILIVSLKV